MPVIFVVCAAGYYGSTGSCTKCPVGQYTSAANQLTCTPCDSGFTTANEGSTANTDCGNYLAQRQGHRFVHSFELS